MSRYVFLFIFVYKLFCFDKLMDVFGLVSNGGIKLFHFHTKNISLKHFAKATCMCVKINFICNFAPKQCGIAETMYGYNNNS